MAEPRTPVQEVEKLVYIVSHDLNTPVRHIREFSGLLFHSLEGADKLSEEEKLCYLYLKDATETLQEMMNRLLELSRVTTQAAAAQSVDCQALAASVALEMEDPIEKTGATLAYYHLPTVTADPAQLRQVFTHLLDNALKFHKPGTSPTVIITAEKGANSWQFAFRDNGIGMDNAHAEKAFILFRKLHPDRQYKGTGAGLAICRKIIERHGGKIWLESFPAEGTSVYFTIPEPLDVTL